MKTKISIIIPVYNRAEYFIETLNSVLKQNNSNWECIVVDDGSDSHNFNIIKSECSLDERIKLIKRPENQIKGAPSCRNIGAKLASSEYIVFLDSDDIILPTFIELRIQNLNKFTDFDAHIYPVNTFSSKIGDNEIIWNKLITKDNDLERFLNMDLPWQTTSVIWNKIIFFKIGGFDTDLKSFQDWELHVRALLYKIKYKKYDCKPDIYYRLNSKDSINSKSQSLRNTNSKLATIIKTIKLLKKQNILNKKHKFLAAKFLIQIWNFYHKINDLKYLEIEQIILENKLISKIELFIWKTRIKTKNNVLCKLIDKFTELVYKDHFLKTKTTFLK